jgi:predicted dehydrogenase
MAVKIGVIGCGAIGQRRHIPEAAQHPGVQLVALCDINEERAAEVAGKYNNPAVFKDYRKMLEWADLDAVVVGTPNKYHAVQTIDSLNAKKHVLVEKPMAGTRDEAKAMITAGKKSKKVLMVGQNQRLMAPHVKAKEIMDSGRLGRVLAFETTFKHPGPDGWSIDGAASWFFKKPEAIMGVCGDLGVHKADLMRYLLGEEFSEVTGFVTTRDKKDPKTGRPIAVDDNAFISMKTRSGILGTMTISWTNYGAFEDNSTRIYCEKGVLLVGLDPNYGVVVNYRDGAKEFHKLGAVATNVKQVKSGIMDMFVDAIQNDKQPLIDGNEGYKSLEVILAAMESAASGKTVRVLAK